jgi:uncharacterized protein (DUF983 family)
MNSNLQGNFERMAKAPLLPVSPIRAGILCRCPKCGKGRLYSGYLTVVEKCASCGLQLRKQDAGDGPAVFIVLFVGGIIVGLALWVEIVYQPPYWVHVVIWAPAILAGCLGALRPAKALMIALQFKHKILGLDDES